MATVTLAQLKTRVRERANMENSEFIQDSELVTYINYSVSQLRDKLVSKVGNDYFASFYTYNLSNGQEAYSLPSDFYKLLYIEVKADDNYFYKMRRYEVSEKNYGRSPLNYFITDIRYRLRADSVVFTPPNLIGGRTVKLTYVPLVTNLVNDYDILNGYNGWDEYVVLLTARKCLVKEEQDVSQVDQELMMMDQRIEAMADNRDESNPMRIYDNQRSYWGGDGVN